MGGLGIGSALGGVKSASTAGGTFHGYPNSEGVLHDTTLCIGCRRCEQACNKVDDLPKPEKPFTDLNVLNRKHHMSAKKWTAANKYRLASLDESVFHKSRCMYYEEPTCASTCFVKAFTKNPDGSVTYDPTLRVGCRYCMVAYSFDIPGYTYDRTLNPPVQKCALCYPRLQEGKLPGCVEACSTGALVFGKRKDLVRIMWDRITAHPERYQSHVYGEHEMGGTAWMTISGAEFKGVGLNKDLGIKAAGEYTVGALGAVPMVVGIWPVLFGGAYAITKRKGQIAKEEQNGAVNAAVARTEEEAAKKLQVSLDKAAKETAKEEDCAVADEVKKVVAEAEEALRVQLEAEKAEAVAKAVEEAAAKAAEEAAAKAATKSSKLGKDKKGKYDTNGGEV